MWSINSEFENILNVKYNLTMNIEVYQFIDI